MKATRLMVGLAFLGLVIGCEPDPSAPEPEAVELSQTSAHPAPVTGYMGISNAAVIHKGEIGCALIDGEGHYFPTEGWTLPCKIEVATNSKNLNALIVVEASGVPNSTGKTVHWDAYNPGEDWAASYPDLPGPPYPCFLLGTDYNLDNPLFTINWDAWVTPSGQAKLICRYQKKWEFQWPD